MRPKQFYIERLQTIVSEKGGKILSGLYNNQESKFLIRCKDNHQWETTARIIFKNCWCPECAKHNRMYKKTLGDCVKLASEYQGECLSQAYVNNKKNMKWRCVAGHIFERSYYSVCRGRWCQKCKDIQKINELSDIAERRGGLLLDIKYRGIEHKYSLLCFRKHMFKASFRNVIYGQWCPECSTSISERICRRYFETIFNKPFNRIRPPWLINDKGNKLELDGYNAELNIAFEHNGTYHYEVDGKLTKDKNELLMRQKYDDMKVDLCKENGVKLVVVPALMKMLPINKLSEYLMDNFRRLSIDFDELKMKDIIIDDLYWR